MMHLFSYVKVILHSLFPFPWQLRGSNARPEKLSGSPEFPGRRLKMFFEIIRILGDTVSRIALEPVPHKLIGVKF